PLQGIPIALKDLFDTCDAPTTAGSAIFRDRIPAEDATVVARLRAAGAVLIGKTNMHEWAYGVTNDNPHFGRAVNPWDPGRTPGGSSGGSAVAVSARLALGALGSDTGGSIRIPSALCGVTGLKPTFGRVSLHGVLPLSEFQDHAGPIAQTAEDCAVLLQAIAGYDPLDPASVDVSVPDYSAALHEPLAGLRLAVPGGYFERNADGAVLDAVETAVSVFSNQGVRVARKEMPFAEAMYETNRTMLLAEAAAVHAGRMQERRDDFGEDVRMRLERGASITATDYVRARRRQAELIRALDLYFSDVDIAVTTTTRTAAEAWGHDAVSAAGSLTGLTGPFDVTGFPAISVPCGFTGDGLPLGLQLIARRWNEGPLLRAAHQYQRATDWHRRRPPVG
ncbi:MAG: amidase, partial [Rudaea sp.]